MKKTLLKATMVVALGLSLGACKKSSSSSTTTPSSTPSFSASLNGTSTSFTGTAKAGSTYLTITGTASNYTLAINDQLPITTGTAVTLGSPSGNYASVSTGSGQLWETSSTATGTLTITTYNTSTKIVTGTFSFTAAPISGSSSNMVVTNGSFANIPLQ